MPSQTIQWFPGHMAKTRRLISENLKLVDIVLELRDARIPLSSKNPEILSLTAGKPVLTLFNKSSLADPAVTAKFMEQCRAEGGNALAIDCVTGDGLKNIAPAVRRILQDIVQKYESKGMHGRALKAMIVGIPNVGKSSLVNRLNGSKKAKVENRLGGCRFRENSCQIVICQLGIGSSMIYISTGTSAKLVTTALSS